jgi:hypothetical protein
MLDSYTKQPVKIKDYGKDHHAVLTVRMDQFDTVQRILDAAGARYWLDPIVLSFNKQPPLRWITFHYGTDVDKLQQLLDQANGTEEADGRHG